MDIQQFNEIVKQIEKEHPLASEYASDARYTWPDRWELLIDEVRRRLCKDYIEREPCHQAG